MLFGSDKDIAVTPTVQAAQYVSGNAIGALSTVAALRSDAGPSGIINYFWLASKSGQTPTVTVYLFSANPTASTVTDKSAFSLANADLSKLIVAPFALTPSAPTGTTATFAQWSNIGAEFLNQDSPPTANIYVALVSGSTFTPGSTADIVFKVGVTQD
jgi:aspartate/tyrosine/aromatic aminotransferase